MILPYVERADLWGVNQGGHVFPWQLGANPSIRLFTCPSDPPASTNGGQALYGQRFGSPRSVTQGA